MKMNCKHEVLAQIARRGLLLAALLAMVLSAANIGSAQSTGTSAPSQNAKPVAATSVIAETPAVDAKLVASSSKVPVVSEGKPPAKGQHEGITVHGHWTIEVKNPDGSLVQHVEFENALQAAGVDLLPALLGRTASPGAWAIMLSSDQTTSVPGPCTESSYDYNFYVSFTGGAKGLVGVAGACYIVETNGFYGQRSVTPLAGCSYFLLSDNSAGFQAAPDACSTGLKVQVVQTGTFSGVNGSWPVYGLQLAGSIVVPQSSPQGAAITNVATILSVCTVGLTGSPSSAVDPQTCATTSAPGQPESIGIIAGLTVATIGPDVITAASLPATATATLPAQVQVSPGQTVAATVQITFQ
jgi:hypothetical protein